MRDLYKYTILTPKLKNQLDRWVDDKRGATAVEFALIAAPFFFLLFGLLELSLIFIISTTLEHGINETARSIRTGNFQSSVAGQTAIQSEAGFRTALCSNFFGLIDCNNNLHIDVTTFNNFGGATDLSPVDSNGDLDASGFGFDPGASNQIVLVRVFYEWELFTPVLSAPLSNLANGNRLIQANVAFRNEPF